MLCRDRECNVAFPIQETRRSDRGGTVGHADGTESTTGGARRRHGLRAFRALRGRSGARVQLRRGGARRLDALGRGQRPDHRGLHDPGHRVARPVHLRRGPARQPAPAHAVGRFGGRGVRGDLRGDARSAAARRGARRGARTGRLPDRLRPRGHRALRGPAPRRLREPPPAGRGGRPGPRPVRPGPAGVAHGPDGRVRGCGCGILDSPSVGPAASRRSGRRPYIRKAPP
jgi:hypothetical protein